LLSGPVSSTFGLIRPLGSDVWPEDLKNAADADSDYRQADFEEELPISEPADVISALEALEHIIDTDRFLKRVHEALKPDAYVLISTPNINSLRNRLTVPFGAYPNGLECRNLIHHVRLYNPAFLRQQILDTGFSDVLMCGVSFLPLSGRLGTSSLSIALANRLP
jgi:2-polyprenyl-3-methyl-5-hydroxy-6-metoxy-1,4-benzoquinol methylase